MQECKENRAIVELWLKKTDVDDEREEQYEYAGAQASILPRQGARGDLLRIRR